jgi:hypothetical protein
MLQCTTNQLPARLVPPAPKGKGTSARLSAYRAAKASFAKRARSGGRRASVAIRDHWFMALEPRRNARRTDAVDMAENIANGRNMSERPVFEWMAPIGYAVRGKTGLAD